MQFDRQPRKCTPKHLIQIMQKLGSRQHTSLANQEDVDIATLAQPQAPYVTNLGRKSERERGSEGRKPTRKTLSPNKCKVDDEAQGRTARDTARLRACPLIQWFRAMLQGAQNRPYLILCASAENDVALLPTPSPLVGPAQVSIGNG